MTVVKASDIKVPARGTGTARTTPKAPANGTARKTPVAPKPTTPKPSANGSAPEMTVPAPENNASGRANGSTTAEIERLKAEIARLREAEKSARAAKKSAHEEGYRGALTKPIEGKVADFCGWVAREFPELGELSDRDKRFVLITLRSYGAFQAEVNGRTVAK